MKNHAIWPLLLIALAACGQASTPGNAALNVTGTWTGTFADSASTYPYTYALQLTQGATDMFSGAYSTSGASTTGTISGSVTTGKSTITTNYGTVALQGAFTNTSYAGSFTTQPSDSSVPVQTGTFTFTKSN